MAGPFRRAYSIGVPPAKETVIAAPILSRPGKPGSRRSEQLFGTVFISIRSAASERRGERVCQPFTGAGGCYFYLFMGWLVARARFGVQQSLRAVPGSAMRQAGLITILPASQRPLCPSSRRRTTSCLGPSGMPPNDILSHRQLL